MRAPPQSRRVLAEAADGAAMEWGVAEEIAVEIGFNGRAWMVTMATPRDVEDLALGLAFTEGALAGPSGIDDIAVTRCFEGLTADIRIAPERLDQTALRRRALGGVTGCGLCGVETLGDAARAPTTPDGGRPEIALAAAARAFAAFESHQPLNADTKSVHAAAWCAPDGVIALVREDVGRHNALDKLIGAMLRADMAAEPGFIALSSRCAFELVAKAARTRAGLLATLSAPTGRALDLADAVGLPLACRGPGGELIRFPAPARAFASTSA